MTKRPSKASTPSLFASDCSNSFYSTAKHGLQKSVCMRTGKSNRANSPKTSQDNRKRVLLPRFPSKNSLKERKKIYKLLKQFPRLLQNGRVVLHTEVGCCAEMTGERSSAFSYKAQTFNRSVSLHI